MPARWWVMRDDGGVGCKRRKGKKEKCQVELLSSLAVALLSPLRFPFFAALLLHRNVPLHCTAPLSSELFLFFFFSA